MPATIFCQNLQFNNISAIIFDKDGTLEDSAKFWRGVGTERARLIDAQVPGVGEPLLMAFGILDNTLDANGLMAVGSRQENEIAAAAYIAETGRSWYEAKKIAQETFVEVSESKYMTKNSSTAPLFPMVKETLLALTSADVKVGILSADSTIGVKTFVEEHQLQDYVQLSMGTDGKLAKPDPRLYIQACEALDVLPEQTIMVGDSLEDIMMAKDAGASGVLAMCRRKKFQFSQASIQISDLGEIQIL